jgi:predicted lipoprotein with Yx(FWY)xxD motif
MFHTPRIGVLIAAVLVASACTSAGSSPAGSSQAPSSELASVAGGATIGTTSTAKYGTVLTGPTGMTLYTHAGDNATTSTCTGGCATAWPPLVTTGPPTAGAGVTGQLGTLTRPDGTTQVTYGGLPLYYWQGDAKAGDTTGQGVNGFSVALVSGSASGTPAASASSSARGY